MNYHALAPKRYKRSVVSGFVYMIFRACSSWQHFHASMEKAKQVLERNQYPPNFYNPIIKDTLNTILQEAECKQTENTSTENTNSIRKFPLVIQYRGKCTEDYARALHHCSAPCTIIMTLRKLKTTMPSLKPPVVRKWSEAELYTRLPVHAVQRAMSDNPAVIYKPVLENIPRIKDQWKPILTSAIPPSLRNILTF